MATGEHGGASPADARAALAEGIDPEIVREFVIEGAERLAESDAKLLELERSPGSQEALNSIFRCFHTIKGLSGFLNLTEIQSTAHAAEDLLDQMRSGKVAPTGAPVELVFTASDLLKQLVARVGECESTGAWPPASHPQVPGLLDRIRALLRSSLADSGAAAATDAIDAARPAARGELGGTAAVDAGRGSPSADRTIRVDAERLDHLVDIVGELVITQSMAHRAMTQGDAGLRDLRRHLLRSSKMTRELQELAGSLRLVPVSGLFRKMARLARDVGKKAGKRLDFEVSGEDTEIDKTIVEQIGDPLVHLVRNAIDHGLEPSSEERTKRGKPDQGRVWLRAQHRGGSIRIEVEDDGRGLDRGAILEKARQRGMIAQDAAPTDAEVYALICEPGFSTAARVTELSGRGVGMDVVKRNINALGGVLEIHSEPARGTKFTMKLPLTLAVIDGMLVRAGMQRYIVPTLSIVRLVEPRAKDVSTVLENGELLRVEGQLIPMLRLTGVFGCASSAARGRVAIVTETEGVRAAILVDELLGQQQAVIKSLGSGIGEVPGIAGCAILPDGRVGLVLDVAGLVRLARCKPGAPTSSVNFCVKQSGEATWAS